MKTRAILTTVLTLTILLVAAAATGHAAPRRDESARGSGDAVDVLQDLLRLDRVVQGYVVQNREATLVLRGADERTYTINTAALETPALRALRDGQPVTVTLKSPGPGSMPIAASVEAMSGPRKAFRRVEGVVEMVTDQRITFKTTQGATLTMDRSRVVGDAPQIFENETGTLVYEEEPRFAGVWIETREPQPSALPRER